MKRPNPVLILFTLISLTCSPASKTPATQTGGTTSRTAAKTEDPLDKLNSDEKVRVREIVVAVMRDEAQPTRDVHREFWSIIEKAGRISETDLERVRSLLTGILTKYQRYFYEDALWALKQRRPFKSLERETYEKELIQSGALGEWRIKANDEMMQKIASRQPISLAEGDLVLDEDAIRKILANIDLITKRVNRLFAKQYSEQ